MSSQWDVDSLGSAKRITSKYLSHRRQVNVPLRQQSTDEFTTDTRNTSHGYEDEFPDVPPTNRFMRRRYFKTAHGVPSFARSFDIERRTSNDVSSLHSGENRWSNFVLHHIPDRRSSFLYRCESDEGHSIYSSRRASTAEEEAQIDAQARFSGLSHLEEPIVTPFAQILASLRRVRANLILLINATSSKDSRLGTSHTTASGDSIGATPIPGSCEQSRLTATETLDELEWCLERLENIQTHRSVSDMATSKFRKMLNKELSHFTEGGRNAKQISEYICSTFLESKEVDGGMPCTHPGEPPLSEEVTGPLTDSQRSSTTERNSESNSVSDSSSHGKMQGETTHPTEATGNKLAVSDSVTEMPTHLLPHGIASSHPEQLSKLLSTKLDLWGMDAFELGKLTPNPLTCVFYAILQKRGLIKRFCIPEMNLIRYMKVVEENYHDVPYHNRLHATDVVQSAHVLLSTRSVATVFTDLEVLSVLFACAIHDVDHPGLTNQYLINTNDQLAILYNDASVLENHHLAVAFRLLTRPGCDLFENIPRKQRLSLRRMTIDMVLATDMSKHMSLLADLKTMVETKRVAGSGILTLDNYSDRMQILQSMIHCADLSNPTKPLELYRKWNARIMEEHFRQGDRERESGLELSPMCDRTTASIEKTQVSFIDYIAHPLWETWSELVHPDAQHILDALDDNREWYLSQIEEESIKP
ncbi:unnamed protein product [Dicrocoelium dendriticum]|nr:unnamed protein product [Dicrocoelium dendriticum]